MNGTGDEWWKTPQGATPVVEVPEETLERPVGMPSPGPEKPAKPDEAEEVTEGKGKKPDRRKSVLMGAAGAAIAGIVMFNAIPDDAPKSPPGMVSTTNPETFLPPAGGIPAESAEESMGGGSVPVEASEESPAEKVVTLSMKPAGQGDTGVLVNVTIENNTDSVITVMSSMMQGDNRAAMVGEGTLAPGARMIEPGETVEGTVEFTTKKPPSQIVLLDLSGEVVAAT